MSRVFILGAGATKAVLPQAPLNKDLLEEALKYERERGTDAYEVSEFLNDFYKTQEFTQTYLPPLEDILSLFDFSIAEERPLSATYSTVVLRKLRARLIGLIVNYLSARISGTNRPLMSDFVTQLKSSDTIISLNYDLVINGAGLK